MGRSELTDFPDAAALAEAAAADWLALASRADAPPRLVGLAGGRIAGRFFAAVAFRAKALGFSFPATHFFWGDERCVPADDPESNFALAHRLLLNPLAIPGQQIHRVAGELAPELASLEAEAELRRFSPADETGQPVLDLVFLGMGEDGHVASLFPGEAEAVMAGQAVYRPVIAVKPPPRRVTLGYPALRAARQVWILVSGAGKEKVLRASLAPGAATPLARLIQIRQQTRILVSRD
jgi:6-phosphogluconolactonase